MQIVQNVPIRLGFVIKFYSQENINTKTLFGDQNFPCQVKRAESSVLCDSSNEEAPPSGLRSSPSCSRSSPTVQGLELFGNPLH